MYKSKFGTSFESEKIKKWQKIHCLVSQVRIQLLHQTLVIASPMPTGFVVPEIHDENPRYGGTDGQSA